MAIKLHVVEPVPVDLHVLSDPSVPLHVQGEFIGNMTIYDGPYEFTPSSEAQTVRIDGMRAKNDIVINPIPSNYGRLEWNGSVLRVY